VQGCPAAFQVAPSLDQAARALVALGVLGEVVANQTAERVDRDGGGGLGGLALGACVAAIARAVDYLAGPAARVVQGHAADGAQRDFLAFAADRVPGDIGGPAGALNAHRQPGAFGIKVIDLAPAGRQGQAGDIALGAGSHLSVTVSLGA
jgi:hypothetical protein